MFVRGALYLIFIVYSGKTPPTMEMNLNVIDYVFYVDLYENLLPKPNIERTKGKRVSFRKAFKEKKAELISQG